MGKREPFEAKVKGRKRVQFDPSDEKEVFWWPEKLKDEIKNEWPEQMRKEGGFQLGRVQQGLYPDNYRTMPTIGSGVREIKLQDEDKSQYRLIYTANFEEGVYVFHVITKKTTEQTSTQDLQIAKRRLSELIQHRKKSKRT
jgi:phage-related protein